LPIIDPQRPERFIEAAAYDPSGPLDALAQSGIDDQVDGGLAESR
jgi:hypothetical protein